MKIIYQLTEQHIRQLHQFYQQEWWTKDRTLEETKRCIQGSSICIGIVDSANSLQGFARVITDYTFKALILDVIVASDYRNIGIGQQLMTAIKSHELLTSVRMLELYCLPELAPFYQTLGFSSDVGGIQLMRYSEGDIAKKQAS